MLVGDYYRDVLVPANVAVSAIRRAGLPFSRSRLEAARTAFEKQLATLERELEGFALSRGITLKHSAAHSCNRAALLELLFSAGGLGLEPRGLTKTGAVSADDDALAHYASVAMPRDGDNEWVWRVLKIRSLAKGRSTYIEAFLRTLRADGCCHPKFNWAVVRTPRLSAENPPVHQIPERADPEVADTIKSCIIPRDHPAPHAEEWDPRRHGSCFRWDIVGAEAAVRAAMLVHRFTSRSSLALWEYIRAGEDVHGRTASLLYKVPEGTYGKGTRERDAVGKQTFFAKLFGGGWVAIQNTLWKRARVLVSRAEAEEFSAAFDAGTPELAELYEYDKDFLGRLGYCEDGYGRRRAISLPEGVRYLGMRGGKATWQTPRWALRDKPMNQLLDHAFHVAANTPTQGMNATDNLWMIALCYHGEYVKLRVPPMWEHRGVPFPEAAAWQLHDGDGPGGRPFRAWHMNTVHDSGWGDCGPGWLEPTAKLLFRRCYALPFDWRLEADVPYRVELKVGSDMGHLQPYNAAAKAFGMEPLPDW